MGPNENGAGPNVVTVWGAFGACLPVAGDKGGKPWWRSGGGKPIHMLRCGIVVRW